MLLQARQTMKVENAAPNCCTDRSSSSNKMARHTGAAAFTSLVWCIVLSPDMSFPAQRAQMQENGAKTLESPWKVSHNTIQQVR